MAPPLSLSIGQIAITVRQLPRAVTFYRDALGLKFLFESGHMAFFDCAGVRLMLSFSEHVASTYSSVIYFKTADIYTSTQALTDKGVRF